MMEIRLRSRGTRREWVPNGRTVHGGYFSGGDEDWLTIEIDGQVVWDSRGHDYSWRFIDFDLCEVLDVPVILEQINHPAALIARERADAYLAANAKIFAELEELSKIDDGYVRARICLVQTMQVQRGYVAPDQLNAAQGSVIEGQEMVRRIEAQYQKEAALEADLKLAKVLNAPRILTWLDPTNPNPNDLVIPNPEKLREILEANRQYVPRGLKRQVQIRLVPFEGDTYLLPAKGQMQEGDFFVWKEWNRRGRCWLTYLFDGHQTVELY